MRRITVDEVVAAYKATGMKPVQRRSIVLDGTACCGAMAVWVSVGGDPWCKYFWFEMSKAYGDSYFGGFIGGFDGFDGLQVQYFGNSEQRQGIADGRAAWEAVKGMS